jgi:hypothetical protein
VGIFFSSISAADIERPIKQKILQWYLLRKTAFLPRCGHFISNKVSGVPSVLIITPSGEAASQGLD